MVRPPRVAGPSVAGLPCSARTSARARAPSTVPICCRSTAAWCSRRAHRCGPPDTSALASPSCPDRSLGSVAHGRASVPSRRSRSFPQVSRTTVGYPAHGACKPSFARRRPAADRRVGGFFAPRTTARSLAGNDLARLVHQLILIFRRAGTGGSSAAAGSRRRVPASSSRPTYGVRPSWPLGRRSTAVAPRPCDHRSTSTICGCRPLACRRRRDTAVSRSNETSTSVPWPHVGHRPASGIFVMTPLVSHSLWVAPASSELVVCVRKSRSFVSSTPPSNFKTMAHRRRRATCRLPAGSCGAVIGTHRYSRPRARRSPLAVGLHGRSPRGQAADEFVEDIVRVLERPSFDQYHDERRNGIGAISPRRPDPGRIT